MRKVDCLLSVVEVAEIIGIGEAAIINGESGTTELTRIKLGRRLRFSVNDLAEWIAKRGGDDRKKQLKALDAMNKASAKLRLLKKSVLNKAKAIREQKHDQEKAIIKEAIEEETTPRTYIIDG